MARIRTTTQCYMRGLLLGLLICLASSVIGASSNWQPFEPLSRPAVPVPKNTAWIRNPIDAFIAAEHQARGLVPRPEAPRSVLLRRVYLDLIGLTPTPEEQRAFHEDQAPDAYERLVDRLLNDPRHGERWGRHWMDIWRYSDWAGWSGGNQIRDSKPHIWRWRDWIIESLNGDKGYDQMLLEMLAADEVAPEDPDKLRATGYLVRNFKLLSREQWLEDTVKHTSQAFLGLTIGCAKCHDHAYDPIPQTDYYAMRAIFEPHQVRTDRLPGQLDTTKDGLVRVYDTATNQPTYLFIRGDERQPDTNQVIAPAVPNALARSTTLTLPDGRLRVEPVPLPQAAAFPDRRDFVRRELIQAEERAATKAEQQLAKAKSDLAERSATNGHPSQTDTPRDLEKLELELAVAKTRLASLLATIAAEKLDDNKSSDAWKQAALHASRAQKEFAAAQARLNLFLAKSNQREAQKKADDAATQLAAKSTTETGTDAADSDKTAKERADKAAKALEQAQKKTADAEKNLETALAELSSEPSTNYKPSSDESYPATSTGRRLAFAKWLASPENPLTARVAMNHVWLRHFDRGIVPTPADFGRNGQPPTHPALLDWLASEFIAQGWSFKPIHRLIVTSATYRMASTPDSTNAMIDPDNFYLWRMPSRRMEAELVRDNLLLAAGNLDLTMGGPEIDHKLGLTSKRRSLYLQIAAEKEVEFLKIFDGPNVTECYERRASVLPHQALALANSQLAMAESRQLVARLAGLNDAAFVHEAFSRILGRIPSAREMQTCLEFLRRRSGKQHSPRAENTIQPVANRAPASPSAPPADHSPNVRTREHLVLVLFNHNDFVTIR